MPGDDKPVFLVLGGLGFIGRNLVDHLISKDIAKKVVAVDKILPVMAWLSDKHKVSFAKVKFMHANLIRPQSIISIFDKHPDIQYVINCAGETKPGQANKIYEEGIYTLSTTCANEAAKRGVLCYVEISNALLAPFEKSLSSLDLDKLSISDENQQWMQTSTQKLRVEKALKVIPRLSHVIVRLAVVYGDGDVHGLTPHLVFAGVCKSINKPMQMLWHKDHAYSTVHVEDVSRALVHVCQHEEQGGKMYYLADKSNTTQGLLAEYISSIFKIECTFLGTITSSFARLKKDEVKEEVMEQHLPPWMHACNSDSIYNTPLYPALVEDLFYSKSCQIDGSEIEEKTNFTYNHPHLNIQHLKHLLDYYIQLKLYPSSLLTSFQ